MFHRMATVVNVILICAADLYLSRFFPFYNHLNGSNDQVKILYDPFQTLLSSLSMTFFRFRIWGIDLTYMPVSTYTRNADYIWLWLLRYDTWKDLDGRFTMIAIHFFYLQDLTLIFVITIGCGSCNWVFSTRAMSYSSFFRRFCFPRISVAHSHYFLCFSIFYIWTTRKSFNSWSY